MQRRKLRRMIFLGISFCIIAVWVLINLFKNEINQQLYQRTHPKKFIKYILLWTPSDVAPFYYFGVGRTAFIENNCSFTNCYVTSHRNLLGDIALFDAVAFNGRQIKSYSRNDVPVKRSPHQKYIYFNLESSVNHPICSDKFDYFFNWTATYRIDSDIPSPYILVKDKNDNVVGPKPNMEWNTSEDKHVTRLEDEVTKDINGKTKAVAWFVSSCSSTSYRGDYVLGLQKALSLYNLTVDVYGKCGTLTCTNCDEMLKKDYYFYLALENSIAADYVTEKVLRPLNFGAVPIVMNGANISRFLHPGSYLQAHDRYTLASEIAKCMKSPQRYREFFRWRSHYSFSDAKASHNVCAVCAALNNYTKVAERTSYEDFRMWWNHENDVRNCYNWFNSLKKFGNIFY